MEQYFEGIRDRIREILNDKFGGNVAKMARSMGYDTRDPEYKRLWRFLDGRKKKIDEDLFESIVMRLNVDHQWLLSGIRSNNKQAPTFYSFPVFTSAGDLVGSCVNDKAEADELGGDGDDLEVHLIKTDHMAPSIPPGRKVRYRPGSRLEGPGIYLITFSGAEFVRAEAEGDERPYSFLAKLEPLSPNSIRVSYINSGYQGITLRRDGGVWRNEEGEEVDFLIIGIATYWTQNTHIFLPTPTPSAL